MFINREYSLPYFRTKKWSDRYLVVSSYVENGRSQKFFQEFPTARYVSVEYSVNMTADSVINDEFSVKTNYVSKLHNTHYKSLYQDLHGFVEQLHCETTYIVIDISNMHLRFLGAFLAVMAEYDWSSVICTYTETTGYPRLKEIDPVDRKQINRIGAFDLNSSFWGYNEIPNLATVDSERDNHVWIAFLGFEGKRSAAVYNEISDDAKTTIPVITMPSVRPGWANSAFEANQILFENATISSADIRYVDALNPFATYNFIEKIQGEYPDRHLIISPLATRPVSLGVLLYALINEKSEVYFDTPKDPYGRTLSNGNLHIYDILSFFEKMKARR